MSSRRVNEFPVVNSASERKRSIIENTPAIFEIADNRAASGAKPIYEFDVASQVNRWCGSIIASARRQNVDPSLISAVMYMETTHGWYDGLLPWEPGTMPWPDSIRPMNVKASYWRKLGVTTGDLVNGHFNVEVGAMLLARIQARLRSPTVEKVATLYNNLAADKVIDYGARVGWIYVHKPWRKRGGCDS